jgi:hypothetical protein
MTVFSTGDCTAGCRRPITFDLMKSSQSESYSGVEEGMSASMCVVCSTRLYQLSQDTARMNNEL